MCDPPSGDSAPPLAPSELEKQVTYSRLEEEETKTVHSSSNQPTTLSASSSSDHLARTKELLQTRINKQLELLSAGEIPDLSARTTSMLKTLASIAANSLSGGADHGVTAAPPHFSPTAYEVVR